MFFTLYIGFILQNEELSLEMTIFFFFIHIWHMPLFFFLAGMSTFYSLNSRTSIEYIKERLKRLFVPFLIGILIIVPHISFLLRTSWWREQKSDPFNFFGRFFRYYPLFFDLERGRFTLAHFWFLFYLFFISIVTISLIIELKKENRVQQISFILEYFGKGKKIFLFALPLILINVGLRWIFPQTLEFFNDWAQIFHYLIIFIFGYLIIKIDRLEDSIDHNKKLSLIIAIITTLFVLFMFTYSISTENDSSRNNFNIGYAIFWTLYSISSWCWLITIFGYGRKYLNKQNSVIKHLSEISLPFYILHMTVIIIIGLYVLQWEASILVKFLVITTLSLFITIFLCELVKTNNITRFIFGMRPKVKNKEEIK